MDPVVDLTIRAALGLLFLVAAVHKLRDPERFAATLADYQLLPARLTRLGAAPVVSAELTVVMALVLQRRLGLTGAAALLAVYAAAVAVNLARGRRHIDCGCAGPAARRTISGRLVARNASAAVTALAGLAPVAARSLVWIDAITVVAATATLTACWVATDRLLALAPALARLREAA